jgi:two-component system sensor histidine kinase EvgS
MPSMRSSVCCTAPRSRPCGSTAAASAVDRLGAAATCASSVARLTLATATPGQLAQGLLDPGGAGRAGHALHAARGAGGHARCPPARPYEVVGADGEVSGIHPDMLVALATHLRPAPEAGDRAELVGAARSRAAPRGRPRDDAGRDRRAHGHLAFTLGATPLPAHCSHGRAPRSTRLQRRASPSNATSSPTTGCAASTRGATIVTVETTHDALRAVADGRADVYLGSLLEARRLAGAPAGAGHRGQPHAALRHRLLPLRRAQGLGAAGRHPEQGHPDSCARTTHAGPRRRARQPAAASLRGCRSRPRKWPVPKPRCWQPSPSGAWARCAGCRAAERHRRARRAQRHRGRITEQVAPAGRGDAGGGLRLGGADARRAAPRRDRPRALPDPHAAREPSSRIRQPYVEMPYMLVARSDGPLYWNLDSLRGKRLALAAAAPAARAARTAATPTSASSTCADGHEAMDAGGRREADAAVEVKLFANLRINGDDGERCAPWPTVEELPAQFHFATRRVRPGAAGLVDRALADIEPEAGSACFGAGWRWTSSRLSRGDATLPLLAVTAGHGAARAGCSLTAWWMRRLRREVQARRRSEQLLNDIAATVPGVAFRYVFGCATAAWSPQLLHAGREGPSRHRPRPAPDRAGRAGPYMDADGWRRANATTGRRTACAAASAVQGDAAATPTPTAGRAGCTPKRCAPGSPAGHPVWTGYVVDVSTNASCSSAWRRRPNRAT